MSETSNPARQPFLDVGDGSPVVFLGGVGMPGAAYSPFATALGPDRRVRIIDNPRVSPEQRTMADFVTAASQHFGADRFDLVGHSFGGAITYAVAVKWPERVRSLVLIEPFLYMALEAVDQASFSEAAEVANSFRRSEGSDDPEPGVKKWYETWAGPGSWAALPEPNRAKMLSPRSLRDGVQIWDLLESSGLEFAQGKSLQVPALAIHGERTVAFQKRISELLAENIPGARQAAISRAGHFSPLSHASTVAGIIREFWSAAA